MNDPPELPGAERRGGGVATMAAGGLAGAVAFASGLGLELIDPRHIDWLLHGDWATHFLGWHLYRAGPWTLPVGATPLLAAPVGSSVGLTDSIPLIAIPAKAAESLLPRDFQYIGAWLAACFVLQGVFGILLMRCATPRRSLQLLGAALLVLSPPLLFRIAHPALSAHWLLLAGLWMHFRKPFDALTTRSSTGWMLILAIAAATHPYLLVMVSVLMVAAHGRQALATPRRSVGLVVRVTAMLALCAVILWQCGYFIVDTSSDLQAGGLGFHSMNLLSPIMPMRESVWGPPPFGTATPGQYEGYAYMGAGMIVLLSIAIVRLLMDRAWLGLDRAHLPLLVACGLLTILALSPEITVGSRQIFSYRETLWGPLTVFRSSGRLFWPVYYAIAIGVLATMTRFAYPVAGTLLAIAVLLQVADTRWHFAAAREHRTLGFNSPLESRFWSVAARHYQQLTLVPTRMCTPGSAIEPRAFILLAGHERLGINAGAAARFDARTTEQYCRELARDLRAGVVSNDELYVLAPDIASMFKAAASEKLACTREDGYDVCFDAATYGRWRDAYRVVNTVQSTP